MIMNNIGFSLASILPFLFCDWHARFVFVAVGYPRKYGHGKSWNRAHKHYKENWTFFERMFWLVLFKEYYDSDFRMMAYLSYIHSIFMIITLCCSLISINLFPYPYPKFLLYELSGYTLFWMLRFIYDNHIGKHKYK